VCVCVCACMYGWPDCFYVWWRLLAHIQTHTYTHTHIHRYTFSPYMKNVTFNPKHMSLILMTSSPLHSCHNTNSNHNTHRALLFHRFSQHTHTHTHTRSLTCIHTFSRTHTLSLSLCFLCVPDCVPSLSRALCVPSRLHTHTFNTCTLCLSLCICVPFSLSLVSLCVFVLPLLIFLSLSLLSHQTRLH